jgi:hypothetical protein
MKAAFDKISNRLCEALEIARDNAKPLRLFVPSEAASTDSKTIRSTAAKSKLKSSPSGNFASRGARGRSARCAPT